MHTVHGKPFIPVFSLWQLYHLPQTPTSERSLSELLQLPRVCPLRSLRRLERSLVACPSIAIAARQEISLFCDIFQAMAQASKLPTVHVVSSTFDLDRNRDVALAV
jgi:hypothetical protein